MTFTEFLKSFLAAYEQGLYSEAEAFNILAEYMLTHEAPADTAFGGIGEE